MFSECLPNYVINIDVDLTFETEMLWSPETEDGQNLSKNSIFVNWMEKNKIFVFYL